MKVTLLHHTPLTIVASGIRECYNSHDRSDSCGDVLGEKDFTLINQVGNIKKHSSTLESLCFNFRVQGISRLVLQEFSRHRLMSLSVKSSRFTLNELKGLDSFLPVNDGNVKRAKEFIVMPDRSHIDLASDHLLFIAAQIEQLEMLRSKITQGVKRDVAKYLLPESYKVDLTWTIDLRSLQNFLSLRSSKFAHFEIRELANNVFDALPSKCQELCKHCMESTCSTQ